MSNRSKEYLQSLVHELTKLPAETEWIEFKCNNQDPERIAKYISALSNSAALNEKAKAYIIWGIDDKSHEIAGSTFQYRQARKGNEELEAWLTRMINPKIDFHFYEVPINDKNIVLLEIPCAESEPTKYGTAAYIRIGSNLKSLVEFKEKEAELWRKFDKTPAELRTASENKTSQDILNMLNYQVYYESLDSYVPANADKILNDLQNEKFIKPNDAGNWDITVLGALMAGKNLKHFDSLSKRTLRVIIYKENTRLNAVYEKEFTAGYLETYKAAWEYMIPAISSENITNSVRKTVFKFPEIAIRELLANTLLHQSLEQKGTNPMIEIFSDRIEFSNPGAPLIAIKRILDTVPLSRNENMAGFLHKCGICEERGSGYDKIIDATAKNFLMAPKIENQNNQFTKVTLFSKIPFSLTTKEDRIRTCYMQACLAYVNSKTITNTDVRDLFGLNKSESYKSSRILKDTMDEGLIKAVDKDTAPRYMKYIPYWA